MAKDENIAQRSPELNADDIEHLPIVRPGTPLQAGETYLDLNRRGSGPFTATGDETASGDARYVAKRDLDPGLWQDLTEAVS